MLRFKREGLPVRAVAPIALDDFVPFCEERELDQQAPASRAGYAAELTALGGAVP